MAFRHLPGHGLLASTALVLLLPAIPAMADDEAAIGNENIRNFAPDWFNQYHPVTALDMVAQVPGFSIENGSDARGFAGTAGNVLIDGERPSTKSTSLQEILQRIPADRVQRIELVSGPVPGLDMRGKTLVVNVVEKEGSKKPQYAWNASLTRYKKRIIPTGEVSVSFQRLGSDITLGLQRNGHGIRVDDAETITDPSGMITETAQASDQREFGEWQPYFSLKRKFGTQTTLNLNGKYWDWTWTRNLINTRQEPSPVDFAFAGYDFIGSDNFGRGGEIGGDFEWNPTDRRSLKLIFLQKRVKDVYRDFETVYETNGFDYDYRLRSEFINNESILRLQGNWELNKTNSFEVGIEGAYNWRDTKQNAREDDGQGYYDVDLTLANTRVEEKRAEGSFSWINHPRKDLTVETGLRVETSQIEQTGDAQNARNLTYFKPSLIMTWDKNKRDQVQFEFRRDVGQLDFGDFATSVDLRNDRTNLGNKELRPDQTWKAKLRYQRKYGDKGLLVLSATQRWINDVVDVIPIDGEDAPGNIGNGTSWQVEAEARIPTERFHLPGGLLTLEGGFGDSNVTDPVTGVQRVISFTVDDYYSVTFWQDIPHTKFSWGFDYHKRTPWQAFYLYEHQTDSVSHGDFDAYIQTTWIKGVTLKFGVDSIFTPVENYQREYYDMPRDVGQVTSISNRLRTIGTTWYINAKGVF